MSKRCMPTSHVCLRNVALGFVQDESHVMTGANSPDRSPIIAVHHAGATSLPRAPGTYLLWMHQTDDVHLRVGKLGAFLFPAGDYGYVGSAFGPGGLSARLSRHLRTTGKHHWHIDWLRTVASVTHIWLAENERVEHDWATALAHLPDSHIPAPRFGASDCRCATHLVHFTKRPTLLAFQEQLRKETGELNE